MNQFFTFTSRVLAALLFVALTTESAAQSFPLPYNPDENGDGLIGVVDLQGLLANYGSEFSGAVISEDGESAITYMGDMAYPLCAQACRNLPGMWEMPTIEDLGLVWSEIQSGNEVWLNKNDYNDLTTSIPYWRPYNSSIEASSYLPETHKCYCAARQLPKVEYEICSALSGAGTGPTLDELKTCVNNKLAEGWMLKGDVQKDNSSYRCFQTLWRWAE